MCKTIIGAGIGMFIMNFGNLLHIITFGRFLLLLTSLGDGLTTTTGTSQLWTV
jgi:hypothetical protein